MDRRHLAALLVRAGLLPRDAAERALSALRALGGQRRLCAFLVERGYVTDDALAQTLSQSLALPLASLEGSEPELVSATVIPRELAQRFCMVPFAARREGRGPTRLLLAMQDPTWEEALYTAAVAASMSVIPAVASRSSVHRAVARWYRGPGADACARFDLN